MHVYVLWLLQVTSIMEEVKELSGVRKESLEYLLRINVVFSQSSEHENVYFVNNYYLTYLTFSYPHSPQI